MVSGGTKFEFKKSSTEYLNFFLMHRSMKLDFPSYPLLGLQGYVLPGYETEVESLKTYIA